MVIHGSFTADQIPKSGIRYEDFLFESLGPADGNLSGMRLEQDLRWDRGFPTSPDMFGVKRYPDLSKPQRLHKMLVTYARKLAVSGCFLEVDTTIPRK